MNPILAPVSISVTEETIPNGVHPHEAARVRHQLSVDRTRTVSEIADAACVDDEIVLLMLIGPGATLEPYSDGPNVPITGA